MTEAGSGLNFFRNSEGAEEDSGSQTEIKRGG